ncbi:MAG: phosphoglucomutase/phosphomannomutase family protein [Elusimicrobia bacterium]|nr:phosphoglucomutase/phosphomannomutase family protein [Elusimicrobiota bacterium]
MADAIKFGTDGWRGVMARDFTFENVRRVAQAIADYLHEEILKAPNRKRTPWAGPVVIGYDRRFQSEAFAREIAQVLQGNKLNPMLMSEPLPTPAVSLLTHKTKGLGVVVTASHNPPSHNGIKIKHAGRAAMEPLTDGIAACLDRNQPTRSAEIKAKPGREAYLQHLRGKADTARIKSRLKKPVVVDYLFGAAAGLLEAAVPTARLIPMHAEHDPLFGGLNPEPVEAYLQELCARVRQEKAVMGLALDGDGDRVGLVDENGRYLTPCQVFPLLIQHLVERRKLKGKIVQSVSLGYVSSRMAKAYGLPFEELPVGFKHVADRLAAGDAVIGGEESGGYAWKGGLPERDGLVTALLLLEIVTQTGRGPGQLWKELEAKHGASFFKRVDFKLHKPVADKAVFVAKLIKKLPKRILGSEIQSLLQIDGLKIILAEGHWLLMRPSGTEPLMRVYAESDSSKRTGELLELAKKWVAPSLA